MAVFTGVGVALVTLFDDDLAVDVEATADLARSLVEAGVTAVVVGGSTAEAPALSPDERVALVEGVRRAVPDHVPVVVGTGDASAHQAAALTRSAVDAGADAVLVLSPPRSPDPRPYYATVAEAAGETPVIAYHFPAASAPGISMAHLRDLPVVGVKDSTGDPERLLDELTTFDGDVWTGSSALLTHAGALGAAGAILALANSQPEDCVAAFDGDVEAQLRLAPHHLALQTFPQDIKAQVAERWGVSAAMRMG